MVKPLLVAISGKVNTGKDTTLAIIEDLFYEHNNSHVCKLSFAEPIKKMIEVMYPNLDKLSLYGPSDLRKTVIDGSFKDGVPLTVRQLLLDLGTAVGRGYDDEIWLKNLETRMNQSIEKNDSKLVIVSDVRYPNEFHFLKNRGFTMIRMVRDSENKVNHTSEIDQSLISNDEFHFVIDNNKGIPDLYESVKNVYSKLRK